MAGIIAITIEKDDQGAITGFSADIEDSSSTVQEAHRCLLGLMFRKALHTQDAPFSNESQDQQVVAVSKGIEKQGLIWARGSFVIKVRKGTKFDLSKILRELPKLARQRKVSMREGWGYNSATFAQPIG